MSGFPQVDLISVPAVGDATGYGGTGTDNGPLITAYLGEYGSVQLPNNPNGGKAVFGLASTLVIPDHRALLGFGEMWTAAAGFNAANLLTYLVPLAGFPAGQPLVQIGSSGGAANGCAKIQFLTVGAGSSANVALYVASQGCRINGVSLVGGTAWTLRGGGSAADTDASAECQISGIDLNNGNNTPAVADVDDAGVGVNVVGWTAGSNVVTDTFCTADYAWRRVAGIGIPPGAIIDGRASHGFTPGTGYQLIDGKGATLNATVTVATGSGGAIAVYAGNSWWPDHDTKWTEWTKFRGVSLFSGAGTQVSGAIHPTQGNAALPTATVDAASDNTALPTGTIHYDNSTSAGVFPVGPGVLCITDPGLQNVYPTSTSFDATHATDNNAAVWRNHRYKGARVRADNGSWATVIDSNTAGQLTVDSWKGGTPPANTPFYIMPHRTFVAYTAWNVGPSTFTGCTGGAPFILATGQLITQADVLDPNIECYDDLDMGAAFLDSAFYGAIVRVLGSSAATINMPSVKVHMGGGASPNLIPFLEDLNTGVSSYTIGLAVNANAPAGPTGDPTSLAWVADYPGKITWAYLGLASSPATALYAGGRPVSAANVTLAGVPISPDTGVFPANPTGMSNGDAATRLMGFGAAGSPVVITPKLSGKLDIEFLGKGQTANAASGFVVRGWYGTIPPGISAVAPANQSIQSVALVAGNITVGNPTTFSVTAHGIATGTIVTFLSVVGTGLVSSLNNRSFKVTSTGANTFTIPFDTTGGTLTSATLQTGTPFHMNADTLRTSNGAGNVAFGQLDVISGLQIGVPVWVDVALSSTNTADQASMNNVGFRIRECF